MLIEKEAVHLKQAIFGEQHDLLEAIEKGIQHWQDARCLDLNLACLFLVRSCVIEQAAIFAEINERVEKARLNLMRQVCGLDLQVAEHGQYLCHGHLSAYFENIEEARDVLLNIKLDAKRLESHVLDPPHVHIFDVSGHFELCDALEESVHIVHVVVKDLLSRVL